MFFYHVDGFDRSRGRQSAAGNLCVRVCVCGGINVPVDENACEQAAMSTKAEERQLRGAGTEDHSQIKHNHIH